MILESKSRLKNNVNIFKWEMCYDIKAIKALDYHVYRRRKNEFIFMDRKKKGICEIEN